ncbi:MAG: tetratricopeptide repeat protein [Thermodesulfobacteriota bacterium]
MLSKKYNFPARLRLLWSAMVLLLLSGCIIPDSYLQQGRTYIAAEDWDQSVRFYQEALEKYPGNTEIKLMLRGAKWRASQVHLTQGELLLKSGLFNEAIEEFQMSLAMVPGNRKALALIQKAKNLKKAAYYVKQGKNMLKVQQYRSAREAFQQALEIDPDNESAQEYLAYFEKKTEPPSRYRLELKGGNEPISLKFKNTPLMNVFEVLSTLTGVNFIFDKDLKETNVTLFMTDVSFERFIEVLLDTNELAAKTVDETTLLIYPDTPAKAKEYQDLQIRTFYLANLEAKKVVAMLAKILKTKNIIANEMLNAVVIRAPRDVVEIAAKIIEANDRAEAEVLLNVEILEVSRSKERQLGLELNPPAVTMGIGEGSSGVDAGAVFSERTSLDALAGLSTQEILVSVPTATINFLKQDADTQTLASPQIRVKNGKKSKVLIGERVPLRTNRRIDTTGVVTFDFQYYEIGVKLEAMPLINLHGEITLELRLEVSSLGPNLGTSDDPQFAIRTRTAQSIMTIFDGEAVVIGGLISDEERDSLRKIPFLSDLPMVGKLFTNKNSQETRTDIIMAITPIVTRDQDVPNPDISEIWSGSEKTFSLTEPFESIAEREDKYLDRPREEIPEDLDSDLNPVPKPDPKPIMGASEDMVIFESIEIR